MAQKRHRDPGIDVNIGKKQPFAVYTEIFPQHFERQLSVRKPPSEPSGRFGKVRPNIVRDNLFQNCSRVVQENQPGTWKASQTEGNRFVECGETPKP